MLGKIETGNPLIIGFHWGPWMALAYGQAGWPSQSYLLLVFEAD